MLLAPSTGMRAAVLAVALALCGAGCTFAMRQVAFEATPTDWERLAGEWRGDYTMTGHDRHGLHGGAQAQGLRGFDAFCDVSGHALGGDDVALVVEDGRHSIFKPAVFPAVLCQETVGSDTPFAPEE